jgi:hypothetical protein
MPEDLVMQEIAQSNISPQKKSAIRRWYESMGGVGSIKRHVSETAQAVRQGGESAIMGGALGLIEAEHGSLDVAFQGHEIPIDGVAALVGIGGSIIMANDPSGLSSDMRNLGASALSVLSYRKAREWRLKAKGHVPTPKALSTAAHHGDVDTNDPILLAASGLGR